MLTEYVTDTCRFLLSSASQIILIPIQGHYDIAFACVAYLASCRGLIERGDNNIESLSDVSEGFHFLHLYANVF